MKCLEQRNEAQNISCIILPGHLVPAFLEVNLPKNFTILFQFKNGDCCSDRHGKYLQWPGVDWNFSFANNKIVCSFVSFLYALCNNNALRS